MGYAKAEMTVVIDTRKDLSWVGWGGLGVLLGGTFGFVGYKLARQSGTHGLLTSANEDYETVFAKLDKNHDDRLDRSEIEAGMRETYAAQPDITDAEARSMAERDSKEILSMIDENNDGTISLNEMKLYSEGMKKKNQFLSKCCYNIGGGFGIFSGICVLGYHSGERAPNQLFRILLDIFLR